MANSGYLESKLFETIARVEALEKPKAKAKPKSKLNKQKWIVVVQKTKK